MRQAASTRKARGATAIRQGKKDIQRSRVVAAGLQLARSEGTAGLTMRRLGEELDVDPTSLYRLFRDKDELILAIYDKAIEIALESVGPFDAEQPWQDVLRVVADATWTLFEENPAIGVLAFARTTGGRAEQRIVDLTLSAFSRAGLSKADTVLYYRSFVDAALSLCGQNAAVLTLDPEVREKDAAAWTRVYAQLPEGAAPTARAHINELIAVQDRTIYDTVLAAIISSAEEAGRG